MSAADGLRGHAYFIEPVGRRGGGPWLWILFALMFVGALVEALTHAAR